MNKIFYPAVGIFVLLLLMFGLTTSSLGFFALIFLLVTGLVISIYKINEITKSRNSLRSKIFFSFIFSFLVFSSIIFFWAIGKNPLLDEFGIGSIITAIVTGIGFLASLISGIILSVKRKDITEYDYRIRPIILFSSISVLVILNLSFYNPSVSAFSRASKNENLCSLTLSVSNNSALFNTGFKNRCLVEMAKLKLDVSICKKVGGSQTGCYIAVAAASNDPSICKKGIDEGIQGMDSCTSIVTQKTGIVSADDMVNAFKICESTRECNGLADMETVIFSTLNNPADPKLIYAIKATKDMWREGQRERALPLLRNLLTTASLEGRKASMDSLLYIIGIMNFETGKQELRQILPLIENQSALSSYTEQVKQKLSAQLLTPTGATIPTSTR